MASISTDAKGNRMIQFVSADGKRRSIRLGKLPKKPTEAIKTKVEALNAALVARISIDKETADWVGELDSVLYAKLAAVGLMPKRDDVTLGVFLKAYRMERTDLKPSTRTNHQQAADNLLNCFGAAKSMRSFSTDGLDGDRFRRSLLDQGLGENTTRKRCQIAKLFFKHAKRRKLVAENPFAELVGSVRSDRSKFYFVTGGEAAKIIEACPNNEWRLIFALSRFGGLRCPSEHRMLRWSDVDWENSRITIHSPKTEHHHGHESRLLPIFPELRPYLEAAWDEAPEGAEFILAKNRRPGVNWRTQLQRIMRVAGVKPWLRLFHNLRATRQTELTNQFPQHVVCQWLGNSQAVANEHYLRVTDDQFEKAARQPMSALQNPVQSAAVSPSTDSQPRMPPPIFSGESSAMRVDATQIVLPDGLEPSTL